MHRQNWQQVVWGKEIWLWKEGLDTGLDTRECVWSDLYTAKTHGQIKKRNCRDWFLTWWSISRSAHWTVSRVNQVDVLQILIKDIFSRNICSKRQVTEPNNCVLCSIMFYVNFYVEVCWKGPVTSTLLQPFLGLPSFQHLSETYSGKMSALKWYAHRWKWSHSISNHCAIRLCIKIEITFLKIGGDDVLAQKEQISKKIGRGTK